MVQAVHTNIANRNTTHQANGNPQATNNNQGSTNNNFTGSLLNMGLLGGNNGMMMILLTLIMQLLQQTQGGSTGQSGQQQGGCPNHGPSPTPAPAPAPINHHPSAKNDASTTEVGSPVSINVLGNDSDVDGDKLNIQSFTQPVNGTVTQNGNQLVYTPNPGFTGVDAFTYTINDGKGGVSSATASVNVTPPALVDLQPTQIKGTEDQPLPVQWTDLKLPANADGLKISELPADGKLTLDGQPVTVGQIISKTAIEAGHLVFTPDANESGTDAYNMQGVGNKMSDYAQVKYSATQNNQMISNDTTLTIDIDPIADGTPRLTQNKMSGHARELPPGHTTWETVDGRPGLWHYVSLASTNSSPDVDGSEQTIYRLTVDQYDKPDAITVLMRADGSRIEPNANGEYEVPASDSKVWVFREWGAGRNSHQRVSATIYNQEVDKNGNVLHEIKGNTIKSGTNTPLTLDLNGDGVQTKSAQEGTHFDFTGTGNAIQSGWVSEEDGLLALDLNGNGRIDNGTELFGDSTVVGNGQTAFDGFEALAQYDGNKDGVIDAKDDIFDRLQVWTDKNGDGVSQSGELHSLEEVDVASLSLEAEETDIEQNGNTIGLQGSFTKTDGTKAEFSDVWFNSGTA